MFVIQIPTVPYWPPVSGLLFRITVGLMYPVVCQGKVPGCIFWKALAEVTDLLLQMVYYRMNLALGDGLFYKEELGSVHVEG